jgi:hypothetical protein
MCSMLVSLSMNLHRWRITTVVERRGPVVWVGAKRTAFFGGDLLCRSSQFLGSAQLTYMPIR